MDGTVIQQGSFISTGTKTFIPLASGCDWFKTYNITSISQNAQALGRENYWQYGFLPDRSVSYYNQAGTNILLSTFTLGFTYVDTSTDPNDTLKAITGITNAALPPEVTVAGHGYGTGDIVRVYSTAGAEQLGGYDFHVTNTGVNTFTLTYMQAIGVAGVLGTCRRIKFNPIYYPRNRMITNITQAASAVVTFSVPHGYTVGQQIRFSVPTAFGMVELDGQVGTITAINTGTNTVTVNISTLAYTAFAFPLPADLPFSQASAAPLGESLLVTHDLADATVNEAATGMILEPGDFYPAGNINDNIFWMAGKSFSV